MCSGSQHLEEKRGPGSRAPAPVQCSGDAQTQPEAPATPRGHLRPRPHVGAQTASRVCAACPGPPALSGDPPPAQRLREQGHGDLPPPRPAVVSLLPWSWLGREGICPDALEGKSRSLGAQA